MSRRVVLLIAVSTGAVAAASPLMDRQSEVALALSAGPKSVADGAGVYVLEKAGYVKVRDSKNGFVCVVDHRIPNAVEPQCMDAEGVRTVLPRVLLVASLRAQGKSEAEIRRAVKAAYADGTLKPPTRWGVDYMLSTQNVVTVDAEKGIAAPFPPHVMFYALDLTNADIGSDGSPTSPVFIVEEKTPYALIISAVPAGAPSHAHTAPAKIR
ncbi:MAG: hypothetical protein ACKVPX_05105 [Myxococcaceae bacterium]